MTAPHRHSAAPPTARLSRPSLAQGGWARKRWGIAAAFVAAIVCAAVALAFDFPPLTGHVVDQAGIIPPAVRASLADKLESLEAKSGIQFVVATVNSLEGDEIEPYANALFRDWKLGEKQKNNGLLLLVAPNERKVRFEVGYGLEGTLTDALSKIIITNAIAPRFKTGDFGGGVERGVDDAITVLTTDASEWQKRPELRLDRKDKPLDHWAFWIAFGLFSFIVYMLRRGPQSAASRWGDPPQQGNRGFWSNFLSFLLGMLINSGHRRGGGGWGGGSGGFSGGGGSSGGGGASGGW